MTPIGINLPPEPGPEPNDLSWDTPSPALYEEQLERISIEANVGLSGVSCKADLAVRGRLLPSIELFAVSAATFAAAGVSLGICHLAQAGVRITLATTVAVAVATSVVAARFLLSRSSSRHH